jgi:protocatechuate 3,4-dioxygenase beta subunit
MARITVETRPNRSISTAAGIPIPSMATMMTTLCQRATARLLGVNRRTVGSDAYFGTGRINTYRTVTGVTSLTSPPAGFFSDDLTASGYAHARKLARDASGRVHLVWHGKEGGQYRVFYAYSDDDGAHWSPSQVVFGSSAETFHPALAVDDTQVHVAFPSKDGSSFYRIRFSSKPLVGGSWPTNPPAILGGNYNAVRPDLYLDPSTGRLHLVASSYDDAPTVYYRSRLPADQGGTWGAVSQVNVGYNSRYADVHANGDNVYIAGRSVEFYPIIFPLPHYYRVFTVRSTNGGASWDNVTELEVLDSLLGGDNGASLAGEGDQLYLAYEHAGNITFRRSQQGINWSAGENLGFGAWPSLTQAGDHQAWVLWDSAGNLSLRHYTGTTWDPAENLGLGSYPNFKLGTSGDSVEWVSTQSSCAPYRLMLASRTIGPVDAHPTVAILNPAEGSTPAGNVSIQVDASDAEDPVGTLTVVWNVDGGTWQSATYNSTSGYYEASWDTASVSDGGHVINARATDSASNVATDSNNVTVDNVDLPPTATILNPAEGSTLAGNVSLQVDASDAEDPVGTLTVAWNVDGGTWQPATYNSTSGYYEASWDTTSVSDGGHVINARATDSASNVATDSNNVTVDNVDLPPTATILNPAEGSTLAGNVTLQVDASDAEDPVGALTVAWNVDGGTWQSATYNSTSGYYEASWDTASVSDGGHVINARATDSASNVATDSNNVTVDNVDLPPIATILNPAEGSTLAGNVSIQVDASDAEDPAGTLSVEWNVDGGTWQPAKYNSTSGYYEASWDTASVSDGAHVVNTRATDSASNVAADSNNVTVDNVQPTVLHVGDLDASSASAPRNRWNATVTITVHDQNENPMTNATVSGTWSGGANGSDSCITTSSGQCSIEKKNIKSNVGNVTFVVDSVTLAGYSYAPAANHEDDGDSDGTGIIVYKDGPPTPTPPPGPSVVMHVGDLEGSSTSAPRNRWDASVTITVHDANENPVANATVDGSWSGGANGSDSCTTNGSGQCSVIQSDIKSNVGSVTFEVTNITLAGSTYDPAANHEDDVPADSDGTRITLIQP